MLWKADQRKREQGKNTEFEYRGQKLTETNIRPRLERKKFEPNPQAFSPGTSLIHACANSWYTDQDGRRQNPKRNQLRNPTRSYALPARK